MDFAEGLSGTITLTSATLTINKILTIDGPGASVITVSGNHARQVFNIPSPFTVAISGLTIANGSAANGGGISNGGALTITDCTFSGNFANGGGGIVNTGNLTVTDSIFSGNSSNNLFSGLAGGGIANTGNLRVTSSVFRGNSAGYGGGGIYNHGSLTVTSSTLSGNSTDGRGGGGGIDNLGGTATLTSSTLSGNSGGNQGGGGIYNSGTLNATNSTLRDNSTSGSGGGIINSGTLTVTNSTFSGNSAASIGGGISNSSASNVTIANSTFNLNAAVNGAGITHAGNGTLTLTSSTLSGNIASNQCGGIFHSSSGRIMLRNTIAAGNRAFTASVDVSGSVVSQGYNLIGNGTGSSGWDPSNGDMVGTADMPIDPLLGPLDDHGGPTMTMALLSGSPALNAGDPNELGNPDQRGVVRSGGVNIGAYQASATYFDVAAPDTTEAGAPFDVTVTARDPFKQPAVGYTGTVTFSSADPYGATLPTDYTFQPSDGGTVTFAAGAALYTAGAWDVTATDTDSGISGSVTVTVTPAPAVAFQVIAPASAMSRTPFDVTLIAVDPYGNTDTNYQGPVTWMSTDHAPGVVLPPRYTFQPSDAGQVTFFGGVTLITVGDQVITATDTTSGISGSATVTVSSAGPGFPNNRQRARNLLATTLAPAIHQLQPTASAVPSLGSAASGDGRLESVDVNRVLPAEAERNRPVTVFRSRLATPSFIEGLIPSNGGSLPNLTAAEVDAIFAKVNVDPAL